MFGDRLKELRKEKNISQEEFGKIFNVGSTTISNWELNITQPSFEIVKKISEYFNVTPNYLFGYELSDLEKIEQLKIVLKDAGLMTGDDLTIEELEKALQIVELMKNKESNNQ